MWAEDLSHVGEEVTEYLGRGHGKRRSHQYPPSYTPSPPCCFILLGMGGGGELEARRALALRTLGGGEKSQNESSWAQERNFRWLNPCPQCWMEKEETTPTMW